MVTTIYYIDPVAGNDRNDGMKPDQAWQSFAPLACVTMAPGDRVEILKPGRFDRTLVLTGGGSAESPVIVSFSPGRYDFYPDAVQRRNYDISNCNDDADSGKAIAILIEHARHVKICGPGAKIVLRGKMIELCIDHSESITVEHLQFDYHRPTVSEYTVVAATDRSADLRVHQDSLYRVEKDRILWLGEGWAYETGLAQELVPLTDRVWRRKDPIHGLRIEELAPFQLRVHGHHELTPGHIIQLRTTFRDCVGVFLHRSRDIVLRQLDFFFLHGMGILGQFSENITLDQVRIAPDPGSGRTTAAWADCSHFSGCRGWVRLIDCVFCGAHDDATNVHGTHLQITEQLGSRQIRVRFMHRQTYGFQAFGAGDRIALVHSDSLAVYGENQLVHAEMSGKYELLLALQDPVPAELQVGDVVENVTWTPAVEIRGCSAKRIPSRGFLLTTRGRIEVVDNSFLNLRIGIHVENDAEGWFESGPVHDLQISRNHFDTCHRAGVCISPHNRTFNNAVHRNIRITENSFRVPAQGRAVEASGTTGLVVRNNRIVSAAAQDPAELICIQDCSDVVNIENNYGGTDDAL